MINSCINCTVKPSPYNYAQVPVLYAYTIQVRSCTKSAFFT